MTNITTMAALLLIAGHSSGQAKAGVR